MEIYSSKFQKIILRIIEKYPSILRYFRRTSRVRASEVTKDLDIKRNISSKDKVLYLGVGTGHVVQLISEQTNSDVTGLDLEDLRTSDTKNIPFVQGNAEELPFKDALFDALTYVDMLHHCKDQSKIMSEALRVLKHGGMLLLHEETIPDKSNMNYRLLVKILIGVVDDLVNLQPFGTNPYNFRSTKEWIEFVEGQGFRYLSQNGHNWGIYDFLPKVIRPLNRNSRSIGRIFETRGLIFTKK